MDESSPADSDCVLLIAGSLRRGGYTTRLLRHCGGQIIAVPDAINAFDDTGAVSDVVADELAALPPPGCRSSHSASPSRRGRQRSSALSRRVSLPCRGCERK